MIFTLQTTIRSSMDAVPTYALAGQSAALVGISAGRVGMKDQNKRSEPGD